MTSENGKTRRKRTLNITSYNIRGLAGKQNNEKFIKYLRNFDIFFLLETHTLPHAEATKEFVEQQPDFEILRWIDATKELGRGMGGCIVGIRKSLSTLGITHSVEKTNNVKILRIRLRDRELNIIPLYIHAKVWEMEFGPVMEALENQEEPINNVILMGDLNIRIGALKQAVEPNRCVANTNGRQSHDKTIRGATEFLTFCTKNNLQILNGLTHGDSTGSYTYISTRGNSTIDH